MTGTGVTAPEWPRVPPIRLVRLHLGSRGVPAGMLMLVGCAIALRVVLHWATPSSAAARPMPLLIEAGAAAIVGMLTRNPFGEPERATGRWLPLLRLASLAGLTAVAWGVLAIGSAGAHLDLGYLAMLRDLVGMIGIALLTAAVAGGNLAWLGPIPFWLLAISAIGNSWSTPWVWPARPPHDLGAAICAGVVFAAGAAGITVRGARDAVVTS